MYLCVCRGQSLADTAGIKIDEVINPMLDQATAQLDSGGGSIDLSVVDTLFDKSTAEINSFKGTNLICHLRDV